MPDCREARSGRRKARARPALLEESDRVGHGVAAGPTETSCATMCYMRYPRGDVGVRELRQNLSVYLRRVKKGETLEVRERGHRVAVLAPVGGKSTALDRLIAAGRATAAAGDLLALGKPLGKGASRRASRALAKLREERS